MIWPAPALDLEISVGVGLSACSALAARSRPKAAVASLRSLRPENRLRRFSGLPRQRAG